MKVKTRSLTTKQKARLISKLLRDKKALDLVVLDLSEITLICDYFVICGGMSQIHIRGLVDSLLEELRKKDIRCNNIEGYDSLDWVLVDFGDIIVHIFDEEQRSFYGLEKLWADAPRLKSSRASA